MVPGFVGDPPESLPHSEAVGVLAANAAPLVGVGALGWQPAILILLYWVEFSVLLLAALVRAAFAGRPFNLDHELLIVGALTRRSLRVTVPRTDIGVRVSSLPVLAVALPLVGALWFAVSGVTIGAVGVPDAEQPEWVLGLAVVTIVVTEVGRTGIEYFYRGAYRKHNAQTALQGVLFRGGALFLIGICVVVVAAPADTSAATAIGDSESVGVPLLLGIVGLKTVLDLVDRYADRIRAYDEATEVSLGFAYDPPSDREIDAAVSDSARRVRPAVLGRLLGGIPAVIRHPNAAIIGLFTGVIALLFTTGRVWSVAAPLTAVAVVVPFGLSSVDHWLRYAGVEYRVGGNAVVAHDRLFRQPLWRVEPWDERSLRVERDWLDGRFGTETIIMELDDDTLRLPYLEDPETVLATFDRRPDRPAG